jgi:hypothetical protein
MRAPRKRCQKNLYVVLKNLKKDKKNMLPKNKFKMAAKFKMATKTKFACKNYKTSFPKKKIQGCLPEYLSFIERKISQKFKMAPIFNMEIFLASSPRS